MNYRVVVTAPADRDVDEIAAWLYRRSPQGARRWLDAFESATRSLAESPLRFGLAPEASIVSQEVRQQFFKTPHGRQYRLVYVVVDKDVHVLHVRGPGQRLLRSDELPGT